MIVNHRFAIRNEVKLPTGGLFLLKALYLSHSYCFQVWKRTFVFTGAEIVNEFLLSTGYLPGAHEESCPTFRRVASLRPAWMRRR